MRKILKRCINCKWIEGDKSYWYCKKSQEEVYPRDDNCNLFRAVVKGKKYIQIKPFDMSLFDKIKKDN